MFIFVPTYIATAVAPLTQNFANGGLKTTGIVHVYINNQTSDASSRLCASSPLASQDGAARTASVRFALQPGILLPSIQHQACVYCLAS